MTKQYRAELRDVKQQIRILELNLNKAVGDIDRKTKELFHEFRSIQRAANRQIERLNRRRCILQGRLS